MIWAKKIAELYCFLIFLKVRARTTETEKKMIKDREERLLAENKSLLEQQRSRNVLLTNLQSIQVLRNTFLNH